MSIKAFENLLVVPTLWAITCWEICQPVKTCAGNTVWNDSCKKFSGHPLGLSVLSEFP